MHLYSIAHWNELYETAETRKLALLKWVPTPNKHDGLGFRRMAAEPDAPELFCAWNLMLQVSSKGKKEERGQLSRNGQALTADDLSVMTGFKKELFTRAFSFFSDARIGWLVAKGVDNQQSPARAGLNPAQAGNDPVRAGSVPAEGRKEGQKELNEGSEVGAIAPEPPKEPETKPKRFEKPTREQLLLQAAKINLPESEVDKFINHYESNGWKVGKVPMRSWTHSLTNWKINYEQHTYTSKQAGKSSRDRNAGTCNAGQAELYANAPGVI